MQWSPVSLSPSRRMLCCQRGLELGKWSETARGGEDSCQRRAETPRDQVNTEASEPAPGSVQPPAREDITSQPEASPWPH